MMKHTIAPRAENNPSPLLAAFVPALFAALAACQGAPEREPAPRADEPLASGEQSLAAADDPSASSTCGAPPGDCAADGSDDSRRGARGAFAIVRPLVSRVVSTG